MLFPPRPSRKSFPPLPSIVLSALFPIILSSNSLPITLRASTKRKVSVPMLESFEFMPYALPFDKSTKTPPVASK